MTLRARLTAAFLAVVLGPVLLGAVFVGGTVATVGRARMVERLGLASTALRTTVDAICHELRAAADSAAVLSNGGRQPEAARQVIERGPATGLVFDSGERGGGSMQTVGLTPMPPADCAQGTAPAGARSLMAKVAIQAPDGRQLGDVCAMVPLDGSFLRRLSDATGTAVTIIGDDSQILSTEKADLVPAIRSVARGLSGNRVAQTADGRWVRRAGPGPGLPLTFALSATRTDPNGLYAALLGVVVLAGLLAVGAAWTLARSTTRPLAEVAHAADLVASGDLDARVPVRGTDEVGRLAATFNRMTREMQAYVQALTASRDQLRGNLGLLGDTLSSTHDLGRILDVILQTAMAATGAQAGVVLLADRGEDATWPGVLVGKCAEGLQGRGVALADVRVGIGEGLLGTVAASGEPRRGRVEGGGPALAIREPRCRTYIAVPFSGNAVAEGDESGGRLLGVLALYDRLGNDEFDDADLVTLRTFAGQAAVAVDNVLLHEEAQRLSLTDPLTGLWNYRYLRESLRREVERANRFGRTLTVLALDLDRFKEVNDTYGHPAGDTVLQEFARRILGAVREVDLAFRQGGEEFVVLLPETDVDGGVAVAQRLGDALRANPVVLDDAPVRVTVSIGVAVYPQHGDSGQEVLEAADDALYAAKAAGRDTYQIAASRAEIPAGGDMGATGGASGGPQRPRQTRGR